MSASDSDPDRLYARGEISREEWIRRRGSAAPVPPPLAAPAPAQRPPASSRAMWLALAVIVVVVLAVVAAFFLSSGSSNLPATNPTYLPLKQLSSSDLAALNVSATHGSAFAGNHSLWFPSGPVTLVVYASPPDHDMAFMIQGMANPTIHVAVGTRVTVVAVNMDPDEYHTWTLSTIGPPYSSMPMMGSGGMMGSGSMMGTSMMSPATAGGFWSQQMSFTTSSGSFWYLCGVAGHASQGMYGGFVAP